MKIFALLGNIWSVAPATHGYQCWPLADRWLEEQENLRTLTKSGCMATRNLHGTSSLRVHAFDRVKVVINLDETRADCDGLACSGEAPFNDKNGTRLGTLYDSITRPVLLRDIGHSNDSIVISYHDLGPLYAISGDTGKYVGASGEAIVNRQRADEVNYLFKIIQ